MQRDIATHEIHSLVDAHYGKDNLDVVILAALEAAKKDVAALSWDDLEGCDHIHLSGIKGTRSTAELASFPENTHVLDVGSGLGGPARMLAAEFGCKVTGLDLTRSFLHAAEMLTLRTGLANYVSFRYGNALSLPFHDESFDAIWMQHVSINVPNKQLLFSEIWRVLKPKGKLALNTLLAGVRGPVLYPIIWALDPSIDFIEPQAAFRKAIANNDFHLLEWQNVTSQSIADLRTTEQPMGMQDSPLLSPSLYVDNFREKSKNMLRNLEEGRIEVIQAVYKKN